MIAPLIECYSRRWTSGNDKRCALMTLVELSLPLSMLPDSNQASTSSTLSTSQTYRMSPVSLSALRVTLPIMITPGKDFCHVELDGSKLIIVDTSLAGLSCRDLP